MANLTKLEQHLATRSYIEGYVVPFPILFFLDFFRYRSCTDGRVGPQANVEGRRLLVP